MAYIIFVIIAAAMSCLLLMRLCLGLYPCRVRLGRNTRCRLWMDVKGPEPGLERSVKELLWLSGRSGLYCGIVIHCRMPDPATSAAARRLEEEYDCITIIEDGESPWIWKTNC